MKVTKTYGKIHNDEVVCVEIDISDDRSHYEKFAVVHDSDDLSTRIHKMIGDDLYDPGTKLEYLAQFHHNEFIWIKEQNVSFIARMYQILYHAK